MTSKKYLSDKKTSQLTISISPALKDWVKRYVNVKSGNNPKDDRFKSISAFYSYAIENLLELFEKGKTLDDLSRVEDKDVKDFFEPFTFRATIPLFEMVSESNRYNHFTLGFTSHFILAYFNFLRKQFKPGSYDDLRILFERLKSRVSLSNISKDWRLEITPDEKKGPARGVLEFIGTHTNLHYEICKFMAAELGMLGIRVLDVIYSPDEYFCRMELLETDLLFSEDLAKKKRLKLLNENVNHFINYSKVLNDDRDEYLWMRLAQDNQIFINFQDKQTFNKWLTLIEKDLQKFEIHEDFNKKLLNFFEKLHWIKIVSEHNLAFQVEQPIESDDEQKQWLIDYLSKFSEVSQNDGIYNLK